MSTEFRIPEKEALTLRIFPLELRQMIFRCALKLELEAPPKHENTPSLLVAVRGDSELHEEALVEYYKVNTWSLHAYSLNSFINLKCSAVNEIGKLWIFIS